MTFDYRCPLCDAILTVPIELEGATGTCRHCGHRLTPRRPTVAHHGFGTTPSTGSGQNKKSATNLPTVPVQYLLSLASLGAGVLGIIGGPVGVILGAYFAAPFAAEKLPNRFPWNSPQQIWRLVAEPGPHCYVCSRTATNEVTVGIRGKRGNAWSEVVHACNEHVRNRGRLTVWDLPPVVYIVYLAPGVVLLLLFLGLVASAGYWAGWASLLPYRKLLAMQYVPGPVQDVVNWAEDSRVFQSIKESFTSRSTRRA